MRFLLVDDSRERRSATSRLLRRRWPGATCTHWGPAERGLPVAEIERTPYAAVLLDSAPAGEDAVLWVARLCARSDPPPIVVLGDARTEGCAERAQAAGAAGFLARSEHDSSALAEAIAKALADSARTANPGVGNDALLRTTQISVEPAPSVADSVDIPGYRILGLIGEGGTARVYLAERSHDGLRLVLKVLDANLRHEPGFLERFVREYKILAEIDNEHVAKLYDQGFSGAFPFLAMEYFPGGSLDRRIRAGFAPIEALRVVSQIARALDAIHAHGIVHRDLKPQNNLFRNNGEPAIVDFGLARGLSATSTVTRQGEIVATPRYMSPEQCLGETVDHRSDLYSLGVVFYEMLSGRKLFGAEGPAGLIYQHVHGDPPPLPTRLAGYQPILNRLLAKRPEHRFGSARELFAMIAI